MAFLFTVVVIYLVSLLFSYSELNKTKALKEKVNLEIGNKDSAVLIINYLRSNVDFGNNKDINVADAINIYLTTNDKNLLEAINVVSNEFFSRSYLESGDSSWSLEIEYAGKQPLIVESENSRTKYTLRKQVSKITVPSYSSFNTIEIRLYKTEYEQYTPGLL